MTTNGSPRTVLCVDAPEALELTETAIAEHPQTTAVGVTSVADARSVLEERRVDCVVTGKELADGTWYDVVETLRAEAPDTPCVLFSEVVPDEIADGSIGGLLVEFHSRLLSDAYDSLAVATTELARLGDVTDDSSSHDDCSGSGRPDAV